ncbi:MAG: type IV toxin-antitoxin system AbiEi family antitoxin domain-containing protein [Lachnospiraceae bacterium]|jgi:predicted transcriptional regulator of viral defense system|nr:type IV toxin-antitoxin system AbiEi family antitoxin domain-containing protein [Lachnospiraceae bacterium]
MMTKRELVKKIIKVSGGIVKTSEFEEAGLARYEVCRLCDEGFLERIRHSYYMLAGDADISDEKILSLLLPEGIICVESALFHYGYSDFMPRIWNVAVPRTISRSRLKIDRIQMKIYYIPDEQINIGKTKDVFNAVELPVYDRERTLCDCFKYRTKLDAEIFNKAVHAYAADEKKNLYNLSKYTEEMKLTKRVNDLMEVILNG